MQRIVAAMTALLLLFGLCAFAETPTRKTEFPDNTFMEIPADYRNGVTQRGKVVLFMYDAATPEGVAYKKGALVYLPYGYDPNDTETRYNVKNVTPLDLLLSVIILIAAGFVAIYAAPKLVDLLGGFLSSFSS